MISPKEISEKRFERTGRGYKPEEVDAFLKEVAFSVAKIIKSYDESEAKIHKLVEKVNQYREDEDAIKVAILGAQKQSKQIVLDAEMEAEKILADAKDKADSTLDTIKSNYQDEQMKLDNLKKEVSNFKAELKDLYNRQLHLIMEIPDYSEEEEADTSIEDADDNLELELREPFAEPQPAEVEAEPTVKPNDTFDSTFESNSDAFSSVSNPMRFGDLRFGNNN